MEVHKERVKHNRSHVLRNQRTEAVEVANIPTDYFHVLVAIGNSFLAWPILLVCELCFRTTKTHTRTAWMLGIGFTLLFLQTCFVAYFNKLKGLRNRSLYYVFTVFTFTSMIDLIIALEYNGYVSGFMTQYLNMGEPYLHSPWGSVISLFDGTGFYLIYLGLIYKLANKKSIRSLTIYWGAAILNSMVVLLFGVYTGRHSPTFCIWLNVPYVICPLVITIFAFYDQRPLFKAVQKPKWHFPLIVVDILLIVGFLFSFWTIWGKGMLSMKYERECFEEFLNHQPSLLYADPAPFSQLQSLVILFYLVPVHVICIFFLANGFVEKPAWLWEMGLIQAGIFIQAQFAFIFTSLDRQIPKEYQSDWKNWKFWFSNLTPLIISHLFLLRLWIVHHQDLRQNQQQSKGQAKNKNN